MVTRRKDAQLTARDRSTELRRRVTAHRALAQLRDLPRLLTPTALAHPSRFVLDFARTHELEAPFAGRQLQLSPGRIVRAERRIPTPDASPDSERWRVERPAGTVDLARTLRPGIVAASTLERLRDIVLESVGSLNGAPQKTWTAAERVEWCFADHRLKPAQRRELVIAAGYVFEGHEDPARALTRARRVIARAELGMPPEPPGWGDPPEELDPATDDDYQVTRLQLFKAIVGSPFGPPSYWKTRWTLYREGHPRRRIIQLIAWLAMSIDTLSAAANDGVTRHATLLRDAFLEQIDPESCAKPRDDSERWAAGYGEIHAPEAEASAREDGRLPDIDYVAVALAGDERALYAALREAGTAALRWPWVLSVIDGWRAAVESGNRQLIAEGKKRLAGVSTNLANVVGRGASVGDEGPQEDRVREAVALLRDFLVGSDNDDGASIPPRLAELGIGSRAILRERKRVGRKRTSALRRARQIVSDELKKKFGTVKRYSHNL